MKIPTKKLRFGFEMPVFGIGTWGIGGRHEKDPDTNIAHEVRVIQEAIDLGITHIDTAESYANGFTEEIIGEAIADFDRSKLFLVSKVKPENLHRDDVKKSLQKSLSRLKTDYLDLYLIHKPNPNVDIAETMQAMDEAKAEGLIKNIGVSNFTIDRFEQAQACTKNKIVANQLHLNLIYREPQRKGLVDYCQKNDVMFIAWRPVEKGLLTSQCNDLIRELCKKYSKSPAQIAINWLISQRNIVTLSKSSSTAHLKENLEALEFQMELEDIERLDKDFPHQKEISDAVPLI